METSIQPITSSRRQATKAACLWLTGANIFNPPQNFRFRAVVTELLDQDGDCRRIARLDGPNDHEGIVAANRRVTAGETHIHDQHIRMRCRVG